MTIDTYTIMIKVNTIIQVYYTTTAQLLAPATFQATQQLHHYYIYNYTTTAQLLAPATFQATQQLHHYYIYNYTTTTQLLAPATFQAIRCPPPPQKRGDELGSSTGWRRHGHQVSRHVPHRTVSDKENVRGKKRCRRGPWRNSQ